MEYPATIVDNMGRCITLMRRPRRIISLVPSQTELLAHLGLDEEVVGITKFCIHPKHWFRNKPRVGGTKNYNFEKIAALQPDLIIGNKEENDKAQIEQLMQLYPVWMSDIFGLQDALSMISSIGQITERDAQAEELRLEILDGFSALPASDAKPRRAAYFIWRNPWMAAGKRTFIDEMLKYCSLKNVFAHSDSRYPEVTAEMLRAANPEVVLLSSEPYPFKEAHIAELQAVCPNAEIVLVDGELFSWYGSRLRLAPAYFRQLIHP